MVEGEKDADDTKDETQIVQTPLGGRSVAPSLKDTGLDLELEPPVSEHEDSPEEIEKTFRFACWVASSAFVILLILSVLFCSDDFTSELKLTTSRDRLQHSGTARRLWLHLDQGRLRLLRCGLDHLGLL